jgi:predicted nuclease of predicted toxin-antitoxin system
VTVWLDAQLSPFLADWLSRRFGINAIAVRHLQLRDASDQDIFNAARAANAVVLTKDSDFVRLLERHGPPPRVVWLTCGNTSNAALAELLDLRWNIVQTMLENGEPLVEIGGIPA